MCLKARAPPDPPLPPPSPACPPQREATGQAHLGQPIAPSPRLRVPAGLLILSARHAPTRAVADELNNRSTPEPALAPEQRRRGRGWPRMWTGPRVRGRPREVVARSVAFPKERDATSHRHARALRRTEYPRRPRRTAHTVLSMPGASLHGRLARMSPDPLPPGSECFPPCLNCSSHDPHVRGPLRSKPGGSWT